MDLVDPARLGRGAELFQSRCVRCHGVTGDGGGVDGVSLQPRPRDYRRGVFKYTSTPYGSKPLRQDLLRTVREGIAGVGMPTSTDLSADELQVLVDYVILLSHRGEVERDVALTASYEYDEGATIEWPVFLESLERIRRSWREAESQIVVPRTPEPPITPDSILAGRQAFKDQGCWKCHGEDGRGQGEWLTDKFAAQQEALPEAERIKLNYDAWGRVAPAADLRGAKLHGGSRSLDIYRRIYSGINGTPMPPFASTFGENPEKIWSLVHFILSLVEENPKSPVSESRLFISPPSSPPVLRGG